MTLKLFENIFKSLSKSQAPKEENREEEERETETERTVLGSPITNGSLFIVLSSVFLKKLQQLKNNGRVLYSGLIISAIGFAYLFIVRSDLIGTPTSNDSDTDGTAGEVSDAPPESVLSIVEEDMKSFDNGAVDAIDDVDVVSMTASPDKAPTSSGSYRDFETKSEDKVIRVTKEYDTCKKSY